jgi:hypothetical protein
VSLETACFEAKALPAESAIPIVIESASRISVQLSIVHPISPTGASSEGLLSIFFASLKSTKKLIVIT